MTIPFYNARRVVDNTGSVTDISLTFLAESAVDVHLYAGITDDIFIPSQVELVQGVDYTLTGVGTLSLVATLTNPGGWSDYARFALVVDYPVTQPNDVDVGGPFGLRFENALDRQTYMLQSFADKVARAVKLPVTISVGGDNVLTAAPSQLIGWNTEGTALTNYPTVDQSIQEALDAAQDANDAADIAIAAAAEAVGAVRNDWHYLSFTGDGATTDYPLDTDPGSIANVMVLFGGIGQLKTTMSLVDILGVTNVRFSSPPPLDVPCEIAYGNRNVLAVSPIPDASIVAAKYAPGSVGTTALANDSVTFAKLQNIATASFLGRNTAGTGDAEVLSLATAQALLVPTGSVVDSKTVRYTANANLATVIPLDDTIPQITEGVEIITTTFTMKSTTNILRLRFSGSGANSANSHILFAIFIAGDANAKAAGYATVENAGSEVALNCGVDLVPGVLTALTISVRVGPNGAVTCRLNGNQVGRQLGGSMGATLLIEEIKA